LRVALDRVSPVARVAGRREHLLERHDALSGVGEAIAFAAGRGLRRLVLDVEADEAVGHRGQQLAPRPAAVVDPHQVHVESHERGVRLLQQHGVDRAAVRPEGRELEVVVVVEEPQPVLARDRPRPVELYREGLEVRLGVRARGPREAGLSLAERHRAFELAAIGRLVEVARVPAVVAGVRADADAVEQRAQARRRVAGRYVGQLDLDVADAGECPQGPLGIGGEHVSQRPHLDRDLSLGQVRAGGRSPGAEGERGCTARGGAE
jgi:hypothetical protein